MTNRAAEELLTSEPRFFIDHNMIHDRITGRHVHGDRSIDIGVADEAVFMLNELHASALREIKRYVAIQKAEHVAWCRFVISHEKPTRIVLCDSDDEGAFKVFKEDALCAQAKRAIPPPDIAGLVGRRLFESDEFCPKCGHNRDKSSVSTIANDDGTQSCQMCAATWDEAADALERLAGRVADAARYRWLNKQDNFLIELEMSDGQRRHRLKCGECLDRWIDTEIAALAQQGKDAGDE